ncbi:hypothetical protein FAM09_14890 [Niastella caeni]|uniref:VanZ-like domain-containing protein n=1 Tax=Niastella caeni TaxID=2569763 RepID=A0A4S8HXL0_9BACT|nr:hypothetical protein [Niastella caeni]THU37972.1 hypothetical protein FAM09_14890 [Niastella caeni]
MTPKNIKDERKIVTAAISAGIILYLSKFLRPYFSDNNSALFILGFLPNLGLAFALPFIYVANRIRLNKPIKHFTISCVVTLFLMILNEIRDQYQSGRVFDWYDIFGSLGGVVFAFLVFNFVFKVNSGKV